MFYVYQNTNTSSIPIGEFSNRDEALGFMESRALENWRDDVTGYAVRDYFPKQSQDCQSQYNC